MKRRDALTLAAAGISGLFAYRYGGNEMLKRMLNTKSSTDRMPLFFFGHGSPMNAIANNSYTKALNLVGSKIPRPKVILVVSAHWMTNGGTLVAEALAPKTIHDFRGFPQPLFDVTYPAPGSPETAKQIVDTFHEPSILGDGGRWGLDHGTWSVLRHLYPDADIPVLQLSIAMDKPPEYHHMIGRQLSTLRDRGVLIIGSGNLVHNLSLIKFEPNAPTYEWAKEFDDWLKVKFEKRDFVAIMHDFHKTEAGKLSVPTMDHYFPIHYILGASRKEDELRVEFEELQMGSMSMRSISLGSTS